MAHGFLRSAKSHPERPALLIAGDKISYGDLRQRALALAAAMPREDADIPALTLVFAHKSITAHAAVLGTLIAERGYVPLNPAFPKARNKMIMSLSAARTMIVGAEAEHLLDQLLDDAPAMLVLLPDSDDISKLKDQFPRHAFLGKNELHKGEDGLPSLPDTPDAIAYLLFTSGSTGTPKGVPVSHSNGCAFIRYTTATYDIAKEDRIAQASDLTFDFSVQPMFMAWEAGACLCVVPDTALMAPVQYIRKNEVTVWISVPSVIHFAERLRLLKPDALPSVRLSMFCGEPLTVENAQAWQRATSNGKLINLYGPTEATVAITQYDWEPDTSPQACEDGVVPIGTMYDGQRGLVVNKNIEEVAPGEIGELLLAGTQVTREYYGNPEKTAAQYIVMEREPDTLWYRTGDLVRMNSDGCMYYKGRMDDQVQIRGYRVVLQEIACALKEITGTDLAAVVAWPLTQGRADGVHGFVSGAVTMGEAEIIDACLQRLPNYMVPKTIIKLDEFPLSPNGKIDRKVLTAIVEENAESSARC